METIFKSISICLHLDDRSTCTTRRSAQNQRSEPSKKEGDDDEDEEEEEEEEEEDEKEETEPEPEVEPKVETKEKSEEEITPRRSGRSVRQRTPYNHTQTTDAEDERSEVESSKVASTAIRRVTRNRSLAEDDLEKTNDEDEEDQPLGNRARRSSRQSRSVVSNTPTPRDVSSEPLMRRSSRRTVKNKESSSDDDKEMQRSRPKRKRAQVDRYRFDNKY